MRKTKIVATVGPSCSDEKKLESLILAGADVFRVNASHDTPAGISHWVSKIRRVETRVKKPIAILVDLQGPRVRTGKLQDGKPVELKTGEQTTIHETVQPGSKENISTSCPKFSKMVKKGDSILLDNGAIELSVLQVSSKTVSCKILRGGKLGENKGINLPHAPVTLPALSDKDFKDLQAAVRSGVDFIALSFVRSEKDVLAVKKVLARLKSSIPIISKIEKPRAVTGIDAILNVTDGIMVARGDLGIEMGVEKIPFIQKQLIENANNARIPVITATQMLESMMDSAYPTRAEASDIANAVFDGTDAVMLSGETAIGKHPIEAVRMMARIVAEAENHIGEKETLSHSRKSSSGEQQLIDAIVHAARHAAKDLNSKAIAVFTRTGKTATLLSKYRPVSQIVAFSQSVQISRMLCLYRGIFPVQTVFASLMKKTMAKTDRILLEMKFVEPGDPVVTLTGRKAFPYSRYTTQIHRMGEA